MDVRVSALLSILAKKPLDPNTIELVARGLLRPSPDLAQRLAIELMQANNQSRTP
jgi:hypothetical protein